MPNIRFIDSLNVGVYTVEPTRGSINTSDNVNSKNIFL